jgi:hypothetical protein
MCKKWCQLGIDIYIGDPSFHSKLYLGSNVEKKIGIIGSSNFSLHGLYDWKEANISIMNDELVKKIEDEIHNILRTSFHFTEVASEISIIESSKETDSSLNIKDESEIKTGENFENNVIDIPLVNDKGGGSEASGLNWWNASGRKRDENEAYIRLPVNILRDNPQFFPKYGTRYQTMQLVTDDGYEFKIRLEGKGAECDYLEGKRYAKQITSSGDKSVLGEWLLRNKLGLESETLVTRDILEEYGRTDITIIKLENKYLLDFSV